MLDQALKNIHNDSSKMRKFLVQKRIKEFQDHDLTLEELQEIIVKIVKPTYIQSTGAPHQTKYHNIFLEKYYANQEQDKNGSQDTVILRNKATMTQVRMRT
jgi:hypothetical protein